MKNTASAANSARIRASIQYSANIPRKRTDTVEPKNDYMPLRRRGGYEGVTKEAARRGFKKVFPILQPPDLQSRINPLVHLMDRGAIKLPSTKVYPNEISRP